MADVVRTPQKRKGAYAKGSTPKIPKLENAKTQVNSETPKQKLVLNSTKKSGKKGKKPKQNEKASPLQKVKPFAGTGQMKAIKEKVKSGKPAGENPEKKRTGKRRKRFQRIKEQINSPDKEVRKLAIKDLETKIQALEGRGEKTKTCNRNLRIFRRMINIAEGKTLAGSVQKQGSKTEIKTVKVKQEKQQQLQNGKARQQKQKIKVEKQSLKVKAEPEGSDESDSDEEEDSSFLVNKKIKVENQGTKVKVESEDSDDSGEEEESDAEGESDGEEEEDDSNEEEEEDSEEEESDEVQAPIKAEHVKKIQARPVPGQQKGKAKPVGLENVQKNQQRYVLFVGNIPYDATTQELREHFAKAGEIKHVRIPTEKKSNKPRGFAYVEVTNPDTYQKCLSMHQSFLKGRKINVLYTAGGKKKGEEAKKEIKKKNLKLHAMRKQGQLLGSKKENQKRSFRRNKQKQMKIKQEGE